MEFVAIDVETANPNMASICQIGVASFRQGVITHEWASLVNPKDWFFAGNVDVHGITDEMVEDAPTVPQLEDRLRNLLEGKTVVSHTPFDRLAINQAFEAYGLPPLQVQWLDSARVARRTWDEVSQQGYGLANVCRLIGHEFKHHDALEDAKAAGQVLLAAMDRTGLSVVDWISRVEQPISTGSSLTKPETRGGNPNGPLFGEVVVFTGALKVPRREAADFADQIGCAVAANVTKRTTMLVVGDQDVTRLAGHTKSSKHRKAEQLIEEGQSIRILRETDFMVLVSMGKASGS